MEMSTHYINTWSAVIRSTLLTGGLDATCLGWSTDHDMDHTREREDREGKNTSCCGRIVWSEAVQY